MHTPALQVTYPFTADLWLAIGLVLLATSILETWLQRADWDKKLPSAGRLRKVAAFVFEVWPQRLARSTMHLLAFSIPEQGAVEGQTTAYIGWAFFILIATTAYTANLAAYLIMTPAVTLTIGSMADAAAQSATVCVQPGLTATIQRSYPDNLLTELKYGTEAAPTMLDAYQNEGCDAMVLSLADVKISSTTALSVCVLELFAVQLVTTVRDFICYRVI